MKEVSFKIDGRDCKAEKGQNLIEAAKQNGIFIPTLCYFKHLNPLGSCRVCTVKQNGKPIAGCTVSIAEGMDIEVNTPELLDNRKAILEMMFVEGNHFCPSCEKSGDCQMQNLGYETGIRYTRFPHLFVDRIVDARPERIVVNQNRCIKCKRCIEEVITNDGFKVFNFTNRGNQTLVSVDYEQEAKLSEAQAEHAMHICPTGSILVKGKTFGKPFGDRQFDYAHEGQNIPLTDIKKQVKSNKRKMRVATTSLAGCFGCHMSLLDVDLGLLDLIELVEFNKSPLTDIKKFTERCDIGLIEGGCCNTDNIEVLREFRKNCDILVSVGECAIWGGLPAIRNTVPLEDCLKEAYLDSLTSEEGETVIPHHEDIPKILNKVYSNHEVVKIDYHIPGCPPNANHIWNVVKNLLFEEEFSISYPEFKYD
ncbi:[NiFe] hydrogenase diaphorase moiety small subunit [Lutibacter oricola]|uniref:[NiFe] hydrogenase diaphorase moiety small subunit n=1 Tax=Lutibacter oricola TaxID=762486 RepID=A0A1H3ETS5_9FLAO|nr:2Fe-2S iron-sulfur cluster-binding protein [Lutibacter oricola]SDX82163.1 [NiFe] hydrogenase diaphorase moiety small subunit [Lutibacter oricola]